MLGSLRNGVPKTYFVNLGPTGAIPKVSSCMLELLGPIFPTCRMIMPHNRKNHPNLGYHPDSYPCDFICGDSSSVG